MTRRNCAKWLVAPVVAALLAGCAQPGELGSPPASPPPAAPAPSAPAPPVGPVLVGSGTVEDGVTIRNAGPAVFSVRTVTLPPGGSTGWHRHPGTEMSIVKAGTLTLLQGPSCAVIEHTAGDALFIPDNAPHLARNDAAVPAELVVTYLLTPGAPDRSDAPPACPGR